MSISIRPTPNDSKSAESSARRGSPSVEEPVIPIVVPSGTADESLNSTVMSSATEPVAIVVSTAATMSAVEAAAALDPSPFPAKSRSWVDRVARLEHYDELSGGA
jgi:hypothetical protein